MASQRLVFAGGNNITLSQSIDALSLSGTITISGGNSYSAGISTLGNTIGSTGLVSQQLVLAGGNNITLSGSTNGGSATITISGATGGAGGTTAFSGGLSNIGNTSGNTGVVTNRLVLAGGDNITLSGSVNANSATVTVSAGVIPTMSIWGNQGIGNDIWIVSFRVDSFCLANLDPKNDIFPGNITVSTMFFDISQTTNLTNAQTGSLYIGFYTRNASTLSIINSGLSTWGWAANANNSQSMSGIRFFTMDATLFSASLTFSHTDYYMGWLLRTSGDNPSLSMLGFKFFANDQRSGTYGVSLTSGNTSMGWFPFVGMGTTTTNALPASVLLGDLGKTDFVHGYVPHIVFNDISSNF